jgi:hypothetical protein
VHTVPALLIGSCWYAVKRSGEREEAARKATVNSNMGKTACNATNGPYRGEIVGAEKRDGDWVYWVMLNGEMGYAPFGNVKAIPKGERCADGQPK